MPTSTLAHTNESAIHLFILFCAPCYGRESLQVDLTHRRPIARQVEGAQIGTGQKIVHEGLWIARQVLMVNVDAGAVRLPARAEAP